MRASLGCVVDEEWQTVELPPVHAVFTVQYLFRLFASAVIAGVPTRLGWRFADNGIQGKCCKVDEQWNGFRNIQRRTGRPSFPAKGERYRGYSAVSAVPKLDQDL